MLTKIEDREIMSAEEAAIKYASMYFGMVVTGYDEHHNSFGYVVYIGDKYEDFNEIEFLDEFENRNFHVWPGKQLPHPIFEHRQLRYHEIVYHGNALDSSDT